VNELFVRIHMASDLSVARQRAIELSSERALHSPAAMRVSLSGRRDPSRDGPGAVIIVGSLGGCWSLSQLIPALPPLLGIGTVVVQQLPEGCTSALADRLDHYSALDVREARGGEQLNPSSVYFAPGGSHLRLAGNAKLLVSAEDPVDGLRPRADLTISTPPHLWGSPGFGGRERTGKDGLDGAREVKERGGRVLVEAEASAIASGTPRAVVEARLSDDAVPLNELAQAIADEVGVWGATIPLRGNYSETLRS